LLADEHAQDIALHAVLTTNESHVKGVHDVFPVANRAGCIDPKRFSRR
jgi:hypothetical protein